MVASGEDSWGLRDIKANRCLKGALGLLLLVGIALAFPNPAWAEYKIGEAVALKGAKVSAKNQDKWVLTLGDRLVVITDGGTVFAHPVKDGHVLNAVALRGPKVGTDPRDKYVVAVKKNRILIVNDGGEAFFHQVDDQAVGPRVTLKGKVDLDRARWVVPIADGFNVITSTGAVTYYLIGGDNRLGGPHPFPGAPVATKAQDKWVLSTGFDIVVITKAGTAFVHPPDAKKMLAAVAVKGARVAADPKSKWVLPTDKGTLYVITSDGNVFQHAVE